MKRRDLTAEELEQVIKLHQSGASWSKIQVITNIPRRAAARSYAKWDQNRSLSALMKVRQDIARSEFLKHIEDLNEFAQLLVNTLVIPKSPFNVEEAEIVLNRLWQNDRSKKPENNGIFRDTSETPLDKHRIIRRNKKYFQSLQMHTSDKVRWQALEEWKQLWNEYKALVDKMQAEIQVFLSKQLNKKENIAIKNEIESRTGGRNVFTLLVYGALDVIWGTQMDNIPIDRLQFRTRQLDKEGAALQYGGKDGDNYREKSPPELVFKTDIAEKVSKICNYTIDILCQSDLMKKLGEKQEEIDKKILDIDEMLDPITVTPIILRTRCDICPI